MKNMSIEKLLFYWTVIYMFKGIEAIDTQQGLIAYDCVDDTVNITSFSLIDVEPCKYEKNDVVTEPTYVQVVQTRRFFDVHVYQCKVVYKRHIEHCGMHSYSSAYHPNHAFIEWTYLASC